jgi:CBS-domain-containing membrane protein
VTYRGLAAAGDADTLAHHLDPDFTTVAPDAHLHELYSKAASGRPIAVIDEAGTFVGIVEPGDIFQQLVRGEEHAIAETRAAIA